MQEQDRKAHANINHNVIINSMYGANISIFMCGEQIKRQIQGF